MKKVNITITFDDEQLSALEFSLRKENSTVQERMEDELGRLYERTVPEPVREYLSSKLTPAPKEKPKRPAKAAAPKPAPSKPLPAATPVKGAENNG